MDLSRVLLWGLAGLAGIALILIAALIGFLNHAERYEGRSMRK